MCLFVSGQRTSLYNVVYFYWASIMKEELFILHSDWHLNDSVNLEFMIYTPSMTSAKEIKHKQDFLYGQEGFRTSQSPSFDYLAWIMTFKWIDAYS